MADINLSHPPDSLAWHPLDADMPHKLRPLPTHPVAALALGSAVLRGLFEWMALWRCRRREHKAARWQT